MILKWLIVLSTFRNIKVWDGCPKNQEEGDLVTCPRCFSFRQRCMHTKTRSTAQRDSPSLICPQVEIEREREGIAEVGEYYGCGNGLAYNLTHCPTPVCYDAKNMLELLQSSHRSAAPTTWPRLGDTCMWAVGAPPHGRMS